jgi:hypothetical protein
MKEIVVLLLNALAAIAGQLPANKKAMAFRVLVIALVVIVVTYFANKYIVAKP